MIHIYPTSLNHSFIVTVPPYITNRCPNFPTRDCLEVTHTLGYSGREKYSFRVSLNKRKERMDTYGYSRGTPNRREDTWNLIKIRL